MMSTLRGGCVGLSLKPSLDRAENEDVVQRRCDDNRNAVGHVGHEGFVAEEDLKSGCDDDDDDDNDDDDVDLPATTDDFSGSRVSFFLLLITVSIMTTLMASTMGVL